MIRGTVTRIGRAICAGASAAVNSAKWSWKSSAPGYSPEREDEAKRQERRAELARFMRPLHEKMLRDALRGPFAPKEITPEA
jgi:hypothetical protein